MVHFAPSLSPSYPHQVASPLRVREQLALADGYGPGIQDPERLSSPRRVRVGRISSVAAVGPDSDLSADAGGHATAVKHAAAVRSSAPGSAGAPVPNPFDDADALEALEKKITALAARIHAATHRLLVLIADFDRRRGWELGGHRSCAHWLSFRTGIDLGTAREKVRTARALVKLPETSASMSRGELSFSKVRAVTRVATQANEGELLAVARRSTTAQLEQRVRAFKRGDRKDEAALERQRWESRTLSVFPDNEGMYVVRGRLTAEVGALLMRAVEAAGDALYREERGPKRGSGSKSGAGNVAESKAEGGGSRWESNDGTGVSGETSQRAEAQRRADALGLLAERALAAGFGGETGGHGKGDAWDNERGDTRDHERGDARDNERGDTRNVRKNGKGRKKTTPVPVSGIRAERYQVMLHVEAKTLRSEGETGRSELEDGTRVSGETSQRLSCDAGLVQVRHAPDGSLLTVGRRTRTIPPALRRALEVRDGGCRFPGCGSRFTEGHHITHWADGGETSLGNCLLLCRHHHRLVHEGGWKVSWLDKGGPVFLDPRGGSHSDGCHPDGCHSDGSHSDGSLWDGGNWDNSRPPP